MKEGRLDIRLPVSLLEELKELARRRGVTVSSLIMKSIENLLDTDRQERGITSTFDAEQA